MEKKIEQITKFLELDAANTESELDNLANDEYRTLVDQMVVDEKRKINALYVNMERGIVKNNVLNEATIKNNSRLAMTGLKHDIVEEVFKQVREQVQFDVSRNRNYRDVLKKLALQSLLKLLAPRVLVRILKADVKTMKGMTDELAKEYKNLCQMPINIRVDEKYFLANSEIGGVVVYSTAGDAKVVNTLRYRIDLIFERMLPVIRYYIFGINPARNFFD